MIKAINFINKAPAVKLMNFRGSNNIISESDKFEMSDGAKLKFAEENARKSIIEHMQDGREYGFLLAPDGKILEEAQGIESKCLFNLGQIQENSTLIHGHPKKSPLSPKDVANFLACDNLKTIEAVSPDGQISRLTKTSKTKKISDYAKSIMDFSRRYCLNILDSLNIDYGENEENFIKLGKTLLGEYFPDETYEDEQVIPKLREIGVYIDGDLKGSYEKLHNSLTLFGLDFSRNNADSAIVEHGELIKRETYTEIGIEAANNALRDIADEYNLIYDSNVKY